MADVNKIRKGLEALYKAMHDNQCYTCSHEFVDVANEFGTNILADAIGVLKEQEVVEPKQIVRKQCKTEHSDGSVDYYAEWFCPHCNSLLKRGFDATWIEYCFKCGKPITWEGR